MPVVPLVIIFTSPPHPSPCLMHACPRFGPPSLPASPLSALPALQFQSSSADLVAVNPELAAGGVLSPGTIVKLPPA